MSVNWGLDLSTTAVRLMHRERDVWREEAREPLGGDDMDQRLKSLAGKLDEGAEVTVFLPRDQILYTEIDIADLSNARMEIETAMDGRTPYALDELCLDWDIADDGTAQIAAIALETLDEAGTFVRDLNLTPSGYSSLAAPSDFPRNPSFGPNGKTAGPLVLAEADMAAPTFVSARTNSEPSPEPETVSQIETHDESAPVVQVDDATPIMTLESPATTPLDPGKPLSRPVGPPRVRTDIGAAAARSRAQSLTGPAPIRIRKRDRAFPTPILAGVAAALCFGIAAIIWSIFPHSTGTLPEPAPQSGTLSEDTTGAVVTPQREAAEASLEPELSDTPPVAPEISISLEAPEESTRPAIPNQVASRATTLAPALDTTILTAAADLPPTLGEQRGARPEALVGVENAAPPIFDLAVLPATPTSPATAPTAPISYPGSAITTPLADVITEPDASLPVEIAALPPAPAPETATIETVPDDVVQPQVEIADAEPLAPTEEAEPPADSVALAPSEPTTPSTGESESIVEESVETQQPVRALPTPTELARSVPDLAPLTRPVDFFTRVERERYNGYTLAELAEFTPPARPSSEQVQALLELASREASELAVAVSLQPRGKPDDFDNIVAAIQVQQQAERRAAAIASNTPDTSAAIEAALAEDIEAEEASSPRNSPRLAIPSSASVSRQATIDDAIRLNRINLIGVYGAPSDRRALVRLSSGRYVKVKVGDRVDGGTVSAITASQLQYRKGSRTLSLNVPEG